MALSNPSAAEKTEILFGQLGGTAIKGYKINRSINNSTTWSTIVSNTNSTTTTYSDTGLSSNTIYRYRLFAINSVGPSLRSNIAYAAIGNATKP